MERFGRLALASILLVGVVSLVPGGAARSGRAAARTPRARAAHGSVLGFWGGRQTQLNPSESYDVRLHISRLRSDTVDGLIQYTNGDPDPIDCTATLRRVSANAGGGSWTFRETLINDAYDNCIQAIDIVTPSGGDELSLTSTYPHVSAVANGTLQRRDPSGFALIASHHDITWSEYCGGSWCTGVSFGYHIDAQGIYDRVDEPNGSLPASYRFTKVTGSAVISKGLRNGFGITAIPLISRIAFNEDWEGLPCLSPSSSGVPIGPEPFVGSGGVPAEDTQTGVVTWPGFWRSLSDPELQVDGLGMLMNGNPVNSQLTFVLGFESAKAGLPNGPCEDGSTSARPARTSRAIGGSAGKPAGARVPGLQIDGFKVKRRVIAGALRNVARLVNASRSAVRAQRATIALLTLDRLVAVEARHRKPVSRRRLAKLLDGLVSDYKANPEAAAAAGVEPAPGQTPEDYFSSQAKHYRVTATHGALWNSIVGGAKRPAQRTRRLAGFLRHQLDHHHVRVRGLRAFSLPRALPPVL